MLITLRSILGPQFFRPHDFTHAARLVEMQRSLQSGEFPVRWSRNFGFGYGMPLFNFYAPLPYYLGQIPLAVGASPIDAIKFLYILNGILAFMGMYLFASKLWGRWGGIISAVVFSLSSYRALDLFVRGALGEAFALVLIPFALYGVQLSIERKRWGTVIASISLAAILLSHNLTGMVAVALVSLFWSLQLLREKKKEWKWQILSLTVTILLSVGLSAFYVLPAFFEKNLTRVDQTITVGYFDYHNHFLCYSQIFRGAWKFGASLPGCKDDVSFTFGTFAWILVTLAVLAIAFLGKQKERVMGALLLIFFAGCVFMAIGRSVFIWDHVGLLKYFQFPWRFLTFAHVFFAAIAGGAILFNKKPPIMGLLMGFLLSILIFVHAQFYLPEKLQLPQDLQVFYSTTPEWIRSEVSKTLNDYLPPSIKDEALPAAISSRFSILGGELVIAEDKSNLAVAKINCPKECLLTANIFQYPGWRATLDGEPAQLLAAKSGLPVYTLAIPRGSHSVTFQFVGTEIEKLANVISILSVILLIMGLSYLNRRKKLLPI